MKLQPNFSWQKYEGEPEDQKQQFQHQLMAQHIQVANSVNATIDDESHWTKERQTSFRWVDSRPIWTKTIISTISVAPGTTVIPHGITGIRNVVDVSGIAQDAVPLTSFAFPLPFLDLVAPLNSIEMYATITNIIIVTTSAAWLNYILNITIEYTK